MPRAIYPAIPLEPHRQLVIKDSGNRTETILKCPILSIRKPEPFLRRAQIANEEAPLAFLRNRWRPRCWCNKRINADLRYLPCGDPEHRDVEIIISGNQTLRRIE